MKAVLMVAHGSRDPEGNERVRQFIEHVKASLDPEILVETCFLELEAPDIAQGIEACVAKGATHLIVIPIMLLQAGHSKVHIPFALSEASEKYPHLTFTYGSPIGMHPTVLDICTDRLREVGENIDEPLPESAVLLLGRGTSDAGANSDLYKITRLLWERLNYKIVEPAFIGVTDPLIAEGVERCIKLGAKRIVILPYFLFTGVLIKRLEGMLEDFREKHPEIEFTLAGYFGLHQKLQQIMVERIEEGLHSKEIMDVQAIRAQIEALVEAGHHHHHDHDHGPEHDHAHNHGHTHSHDQAHNHGHTHGDDHAHVGSGQHAIRK